MVMKEDSEMMEMDAEDSESDFEDDLYSILDD